MNGAGGFFGWAAVHGTWGCGVCIPYVHHTCHRSYCMIHDSESMRQLSQLCRLRDLADPARFVVPHNVSRREWWNTPVCHADRRHVIQVEGESNTYIFIEVPSLQWRFTPAVTLTLWLTNIAVTVQTSSSTSVLTRSHKHRVRVSV